MASIDIAPGRPREHDVIASGRALAPLAGVVAMALLLAAFLVSGSSPDEAAKIPKILTYYHDHKTQTVVSAVLAALTTPFLVIFGTAVREALRRGDGAAKRWADAALAGGALAAVGLLTAALFSFALADGAEQHYAATTMQTFNALSADSWIVFVPGFGVLAIAVGAGGLTSGALGRKLSWVVLAIGVLCFVPFASFFAFVSAILWIPIVGVKLSSASS